MSLDYAVMVWDPNNVGMRDDSFLTSIWAETSTVRTHIDGDYVKLEVAGLSEAIIPAGETSVVVVHGCSSTPKPIANPQIDILGRDHWVDTVGATYFTIHVGSSMSVDIPFWWASPTSGCTGGAGGTGYIEKTGISVNSADYPYICLALWGTNGYFVEVYNGSWHTVVSDACPPKYGFKVHYIGDLGLGTITRIRLGVMEIPSDWVIYDFVEFHSKVPQYPADMINAEIHQRRDSSDYFQLNVVQNGYVGSDAVLLMNFEEDEGEKVFDESVNGHVGTFNEHGILELYEDDEDFWTNYNWGSGSSYEGTSSEETTVVKSGQSSLKKTIGAGIYYHTGIYRVWSSGQDFSNYDFFQMYFYGAGTGDTIRVYMATTGNFTDYYAWNFIDDVTGWKRITLSLSDPDITNGSPDWTSIKYLTIGRLFISSTKPFYIDRVWLVQGPAFVETDYGLGLQFDGDDDYVNCGKPSPPLSTMSVFAWVKTDISDAAVYGIVGKCNNGGASGWGLIVYQNDLRYSMRNALANYQQSDANLADGVLIHVGATHNSVDGEIILYVNGAAVASTGVKVAGQADPDAYDLTIGARHGGLYNNFKGVIDAPLISNRILAPSEVKQLYNNCPPSRIYVRGRYLRIVLDNGTNRDKVFSGVIQNTIPKQGVLYVDGQCLQMKINRGTINEEYVDEDLDSAVSDLAANYPEVTTGRVEAPSPNIPYTKTYDEVFGRNALDEMASVPSKQTPYDMWIWELGYGLDLSFRAYNDASVRACTVPIEQDINVLRGIKRAEDIYELSNKVVVIGGLMKHPEEDGWCDSTTGWTTQNIISFTAQTTTRTTGTHGMRVYADDDNLHYVHRDVAEFDATKYKRIVFDVWWDGNQEDESATMDIQVHSAVSGYHSYSLVRSSQKGLTTGEWVRHSIDLDDPMWGSSGSPEWDDIDGIRFFCVNGSLVQFTYYIDNIHFETDNEKDTATASIDRAFEDRVYVYKDVKITKLNDLKVFSEGLVRALQEVSQRFMIPVLGEPDFQRGRKVPVDIPYYDLNGDYYIAEVSHLIGRDHGYYCEVLLSTGRMDFSLEIAKTLAKDLRRESAGGVTL